MAKEEEISATGVVIESFPNAVFRVRLDNGLEAICRISGKIRMNNITILEGDSVNVGLSPYDVRKGRITKRL